MVAGGLGGEEWLICDLNRWGSSYSSAGNNQPWWVGSLWEQSKQSALHGQDTPPRPLDTVWPETMKATSLAVP